MSLQLKMWNVNVQIVLKQKQAPITPKPCSYSLVCELISKLIAKGLYIQRRGEGKFNFSTPTGCTAVGRNQLSRTGRLRKVSDKWGSRLVFFITEQIVSLSFSPCTLFQALFPGSWPASSINLDTYLGGLIMKTGQRQKRGATISGHAENSISHTCYRAGCQASRSDYQEIARSSRQDSLRGSI